MKVTKNVLWDDLMLKIILMFKKYWKDIFLSNNYVFVVRGSKIILSVIDWTSKHKISKIDIYWYKTYRRSEQHHQPTWPNWHIQNAPPITSKIHIVFNSRHRAFTKIDHFLGHKTNLNKFKKSDIIQNLSSDHMVLN